MKKRTRSGKTKAADGQLALQLGEERLKAERLATIGLLASRLSGELRQPLSVIRNAIYFLNIHLSTDVDDKVRKHLGIMLREINGATRLVGNLSYLGSTRPPERGMSDIEVIVAAALDHIVRPPEVRIRLAIKPDAMLFCDPSQVRLALANIISNSAQALQSEGEIKVICTQTATETRIEVTDNGPGMTRDVLAQVFEPLFTTAEHRTGLGMTIVRHLVGANGGTVEVKSEPGKGTTVLLRFARFEHETGFPTKTNSAHQAKEG